MAVAIPISMRTYADKNKKDVTRGKEIVTVPLSEIFVEPGWNVRVMNDRLRAHIDWLKVSILENGIQEALWGYPVQITEDDGTVVRKMCPLNGHNRYTAAKELEDEGHKGILVPFTYKAKLTEEERKALILSSNSGLPLTELEKAEVVRYLDKKGWSIDKIAANYNPGDENFSTFGATEEDILKKVKAKIKWLISLGSASTSAKELVEAGVVAPTNVVAAIKALGDDPDRGSKVVEATAILAKANDLTTSAGKITGAQVKEVVEQVLELPNPDEVLDAVLEAQHKADETGLPVLEALPQDLKIPQLTEDAGRPRGTAGSNNKDSQSKPTSSKPKSQGASIQAKTAYLYTLMQGLFEGGKLLNVVENSELSKQLKLLPADDYAIFKLANGKVCILPHEFLNSLALPGYEGGNLELNLAVIEEPGSTESQPTNQSDADNLIVVAKH
jgi:hypothetical protein